MWILAIASIAFLAIVMMMIIGSYASKSQTGNGAAVTRCGPSGNCCQCNSMPCQCAQILPGQTRCPVCGLNGIQPTAAPGIQNCSGCRRAFRCPGCLLGN